MMEYAVFALVCVMVSAQGALWYKFGKLEQKVNNHIKNCKGEK